MTDNTLNWERLDKNETIEELIRKIEALQYMKEHPGNVCPAKWTK